MLLLTHHQAVRRKMYPLPHLLDAIQKHLFDKVLCHKSSLDLRLPYVHTKFCHIRSRTHKLKNEFKVSYRTLKSKWSDSRIMSFFSNIHWSIAKCSTEDILYILQPLLLIAPRLSSSLNLNYSSYFHSHILFNYLTMELLHWTKRRQ